MSYSSAGILTLAILLIINQDILGNRLRREIIPAHQSYRIYLLMVIGYTVTDIFWGFLYERQMIVPVFADTALYFLFMSFTILFWTRFVIEYLNQKGKFSIALTITGLLIFCFQIIVLVINFFQPILYSFDAAGAYHAEPARYVTLTAQIAMFTFTAGYAFAMGVASTGTMRIRHRTIAWCSAFMAVLIIAQALYPLLPLYAIGCLLGTCVLHSLVLENEKEEYRYELEEQLQESLEKGNTHDRLTDLSTMTFFFEQAEKKKEEILNAGQQPVFLYIDFRGMKFYNRKYGFQEGDRLLQSFAKTLVRTFGKENCCRIGGDHFAAVSVTDALEDRLRQFFRECQDMNEGRSLPVHIGIYSGQEGEVPVSIACDRAKLACNQLRGAYASRFSYYSKKLNDDVENRQYVIENFDRAVREHWIKVYYQPIVRAANRKVCDEEALSRWIDPQKGLLSPDEFIPTLEEAGLIYKLDLYVLDRVLEKMKSREREGLVVVPQSINLSRSDFSTCDIVNEICRRVDEAGIERSRITIEITESIIGSDFEFIKEQVARIRECGFPVWIDDFGSGYSSLDVLQSLGFDLIKFDMGFMRRFDEGESGKVILTELVQMATSLGVETVCEGVETDEQAAFLQEIGCSRLQGYHFGKPAPYEPAVRVADTDRIGYENPAESAYYEAIGSVNLYDLTSIMSEEDKLLPGFFDTLPMSIIEIREGKAEYVRSNSSYRAFMERYFGLDVSDLEMDFLDRPEQYGMNFVRAVHQCSVEKNRTFFDERMSDGSLVHCFIRRISRNPVTEKTAAVIAVLSVTDPGEETSYAEIARALAADYYNIYVVDLDTEDFIEYSSEGVDELAVERHGIGFFESVRRDTRTRIYEEDRDLFLNWFSKENLIRELDQYGVFTTTYRLIDSGSPVYVTMKITRLQRGKNRIILGVSVIDTKMKPK